MKVSAKFLLVLCLIACIKSKAQDSSDVIVSSETMIIRIIESNSFGILNNIESKMIIVGNNRTEIKDLKRINFSLNGNDGIEFNTIAVQKEIQKWQDVGFYVKSSNSAVPKADIVVTTIILQKN